MAAAGVLLTCGEAWIAALNFVTVAKTSANCVSFVECLAVKSKRSGYARFRLL
jgi:hypothetical protein